MKIGILSMQRVVNFGSVLQAYSLRQILQELTQGQVTFLDIEDSPALVSRRTLTEDADYEAPAAYPSGLLQRAKRRTIALLSGRNKKGIRAFMERELQLSQTGADCAFDHVVVGSDEVFNHSRNIRLQLHGQVRQAEHVFAYAASCGSARPGDIAPEDRDKVREAMSRFSAISVRDGVTEDYVKAYYDGPVFRHLDPVLVGNLHLRAHKPVWLKNYLLVYAYGQRIRTAEEISAIRDYARKRGLKILALGGSQFWCDLYLPVSPFWLLDYFYHADCVVTDTFHGTIFSVIHHKRFAVIPRPTNRGKLNSLLEDLKLGGRMLDTMADLAHTLDRDVDYAAVEEILERERERTRNYLRAQLGGNHGTDCTG